MTAATPTCALQITFCRAAPPLIKPCRGKIRSAPTGNAYLRVKPDWAKDKIPDDSVWPEHHYGSGKEVLTYGIDLDFLLAHPNIDVAPIKDSLVTPHEADSSRRRILSAVRRTLTPTYSRSRSH